MYFPLHVHSDASLLDGLSQPHQIAARCKQEELLGSAMTDHGSVANAINFSKTMLKEGLKPIIGVEFYVCHEDPTLRSDRKLTHLVILAKNIEGWKQLIKMTSEANDPSNFYYKPRLDLDSIAKFCDGNLIGISGHIGSCISDVVFSDVHAAANSTTKEEAVQYVNVGEVDKKARELEEIFGVGNFFLEIQLIDSERMPAASVLADVLRECGKRTEIPCVATPDAHYASREDAVDQRVLLCTSLNITMQEVRKKLVRGDDVALGGFFKSNNYHIPSYQDMLDCGHTEEELNNTLIIADMCEEYKLTAPPTLPIFDKTKPSAQYLREQCRIGWKNRKKNIDRVIANTDYTHQTYVDRVESELGILENVQFKNGSCLSDYFLIVQDIINFALKDGQLIGPGRGSAAGSLVLYLLGVTQIDPIQHDLLFSRFYNGGRNTKDRVSLPDVDMDFQTTKRNDIINYMKDRFGHGKVAQMLTFTRMQGRSALKDVMRAWSACSFSEMNEMTKCIPDEAEISDQLQIMKEESESGEASIIQWALENHEKELSPWVHLDEDGNIQGEYAKQFEQAIRLEGTKRSQSKHAAGVIISESILADVCPMVFDKTTGEMICGMEMGDLESAGHVKYDILAISCLDKVKNWCDLLYYGEFQKE